MVFLRDRGKRHAGHAVDRGPELVVRDPCELLADHDVAHRQEAPGLHAAQGADREQHSRLHLDAEHPALGPTAMPLGVRVVEGVARGDRADAERLAELLRRVHRRVNELPVGRRHVGLLADVVARRAVGGDGRDGDDQVAELQVVLEPAAGADA